MTAFIRLHIIPTSVSRDGLVLVNIGQIGFVRATDPGGSYINIHGDTVLVNESPTEIDALVSAAENSQ